MTLTADSLVFDDVVMRPAYYEFYYPEADVINTAVIAAYQLQLDAGKARKTHLFAGRYENIYIDRQQIAGLSGLITFWIKSAAEALNRDTAELRCGFWFNDMQPGDVTQPHSHDDDDEWLSGVYYLSVPKKSGELILHVAGEKNTVQAAPGKLVLFASSEVHEVTKNCSDEQRLSIGINFGDVNK